MPQLVKSCPYCGLLMWPKEQDIEYPDEHTLRLKCPHCQRMVRFSLISQGSTASGPKMGH